jgi:hypothetical protein
MTPFVVTTGSAPAAQLEEWAARQIVRPHRLIELTPDTGVSPWSATVRACREIWGDRANDAMRPTVVGRAEDLLETDAGFLLRACDTWMSLVGSAWQDALRSPSADIEARREPDEDPRPPTGDPRIERSEAYLPESLHSLVAEARERISGGTLRMVLPPTPFVLIEGSVVRRSLLRPGGARAHLAKPAPASLVRGRAEWVAAQPPHKLASLVWSRSFGVGPACAWATCADATWTTKGWDSPFGAARMLATTIRAGTPQTPSHEGSQR